MEKELKRFAIEREQKKSEHDRYINFEHKLRYLLCELETPTDREDSFLLDDIKQAVIVFSMKDKFGEINDIFLANMKNDFYTAIEKLESRHPDIKSGTYVIKLFMEDFYFNK